ncbi:prepilin peptidase [Streptomyces scopuliridis]|uniref:Peptidase n=1 Tax=Streptomyces scopuliridis RB72 TaxID=1440053 RepID=A0A2T7TAB2_9ACTN|nr:prepilin peptidase [Streptomyces scopuliridis]PVE12055.1 peptidase [Streptomyces scopuliridis RB72]
MYATLIVVAALWGTATGLLLPRAAYRLSVEPEDPWRDSCPAGHPITGPAGGWLGVARCTGCAAAARSGTAESSGADVKSPGVGTGHAAAGPASAATDPVGTATDTAAGPETGSATGTAAGSETGTAAGSASAAAGASSARVRYAPSPLVPLLTALVCAVLAAATGPRPELAVWLLLTPFAVLLALVDRAVHRLPDRLTLPLAAAAVVLLGLAALLPGGGGGGNDGTGPGGSWPTALLGGLALGACYFVLFLINPNGLGFGDVKLALSLGVVLGWYGWLVLFVGAFAGFLMGSLYGFGLILLRRAGRKSAFPFGPFMIVGALTGIVLGALAGA